MESLLVPLTVLAWFGVAVVAMFVLGLLAIAGMMLIGVHRATREAKRLGADIIREKRAETRVNSVDNVVNL